MLYRHFKGQIYELLHRAVDEATQEVTMVYREYGTEEVFTRSERSFFEPVSGRKDNVMNQFHRFEPYAKGLKEYNDEELLREMREREIRLLPMTDLIGYSYCAVYLDVDGEVVPLYSSKDEQDVIEWLAKRTEYKRAKVAQQVFVEV